MQSWMLDDFQVDNFENNSEIKYMISINKAFEK